MKYIQFPHKNRLFFTSIAVIVITIGVLIFETMFTSDFINHMLESERKTHQFYEITSAISEAETGILTYYLGTELNGQALINSAIYRLRQERAQNLPAEDKELVDKLIHEFSTALQDLEHLDEKLNDVKTAEDIEKLWLKKNELLSHYLALQDQIILKEMIKTAESKRSFLLLRDEAMSSLKMLKTVLFLLCSLLGTLLFVSIKARKRAMNREEKLAKTILEVQNKNSILSEQKDKLELQEKIISQTGKFKSLGEVAGAIGHDLNNTVSVVSIRAEQLVTKLNNKEEIPQERLLKNMQSIFKASEKLAKLTKSIRDFSRVSNVDPFREESLCEIINETQDFFLSKLRSRKIIFSTEIESKDIVFDCRKMEMIQLILNLVNNAADEIEKFKIREIRIEAKKSDSCLELRVIDSGDGLKDSDIGIITQSHYTTKEQGKGTGLGLSICSKIVESHCGTFEIDQSYASTCFLIQLPLKQPMPNEDPQLEEVS